MTVLTPTHFGLSDRGRIRSENEDKWKADSKEGLYIVSDGLGGHAAGALASQLVIETLPAMLTKSLHGVDDLERPNVMKQAKSSIAKLSQSLYEHARGKLGLGGMGATVVLVVVREGKALVAHMGDSRAYLYREGLFEQLTKDHSIVQVLVENEEILPEDAESHPAHGQLTRFVGMEGEPLPDVRAFKLRAKDRVFLCTDGLTDLLADDQILRILERESNLENACRGLIQAANDAGGKDNITALIVEMRDVGSGKRVHRGGDRLRGDEPMRNE